MKTHIIQLISAALDQLQTDAIIPSDITLPDIVIANSKNPEHGDFACNIALMLAKPAQRSPRELAQAIIAALPKDPIVDKVEIAGPGFINFFVNPAANTQIITAILTEGDNFGRSQIGAGQTVLLEFVSANPTGPLHVGHGRGAAYGQTLADLLTAAGYQVTREYYVNDAGRQMDILTVSIWLRYLEQCGEIITLPGNAYQGEYIKEIAQQLLAQNGKKYCRTFAELTADLPGYSDDTDAEQYIDALIARSKILLGADYQLILDFGLNDILTDIRLDLTEFGVEFERWFPERSLTQDKLTNCISKLQQSGYIYEQEGALWFKSSAFGDEKDRVVVRENGQPTYFATDIAYHQDKLERGYQRLINIWGADHHGYIARMQAGVSASGYAAERLEILLVQFATLYRGKEKLSMSTRSGSFVTLRELRNEVGKDAARFFYTMRRTEQHMDFDLELAKSRSNENPVYYVQYAHARIASVFRQLEQQGYTYEQQLGLAQLNQLNTTAEQQLLSELARYPEVLANAAQQYAPYQLTHYLRELAQAFHSYYNAHVFLMDDALLRNARLTLILATQQVLKNALCIIGVTAPDSM